MSSAFQRFKDSYYRRFSRDGPPLFLLDQMDEREREKVERLLLRKLGPGDLDSIQVLGYLCSQRAFAPLVEMLPKADDVSRVFIARALWRINRYEPALSILCQTLMPESLASSDARVRAAIALSEIPEEPAIRALGFALKDDDDLVRYHAQRSLAVLLGLRNELELLEQEMTGPFHERQMAAETLRRLVENALHDYLSTRGSSEE